MSTEAFLRSPDREVIDEQIHRRSRQRSMDRYDHVESFTSRFSVGEHPAAEMMRKMKPLIAKIHDEELFQHFNEAMKSVKRMSGNLVPVADASASRSREQESNAQWEQSVKARRSELLGAEREKPQLKRTAADSTSRTDDEAWGVR